MIIDLNGPDGNAYALMAYAKKLGRQLDFTSKQTNQILNEMRSGDYQNLLEVFKENFGDYVELIGEQQ
jgi:hypothetical protein